jgi:hypothetical protein
MLVKENISFERGKKPKISLGLNPVFDKHVFIDEDEAGEYIIKNLHTILGLPAIPIDILGYENTEWINKKYLKILINYIESYIFKNTNYPISMWHVFKYIHDELWNEFKR